MERSFKRREFLRTTGAAGVIGLMHGYTAMPSPAGSGAATARAPQAKILETLETIHQQYLTVSEKEGQFLNLLVKATRGKNVLEVGTSYGYTTIWLALALEETDGNLTTIEILPERIALAKRHVTQAGLSHRVTFLQGDAHSVVPTLPGVFDWAYLDADKDRQEDYFHQLFPKRLRPGGLLIAHNAILLADTMKAYLDLVRHHPDFDTVIVSATGDDGFAVSYRKRLSE